MKVKSGILSLNFNQNFECFVCGCEDGFRIFNSSPLKEVRREYFAGGISFGELLYRCNYVGIVGASTSLNTKAIVWDCNISKAVIDLEMGERVFTIRLRRDFIVVVVENAVAVFTFSDIPVQLMHIRCAHNSSGLCALSTTDEYPYVAFPSAIFGAIEVVHLPSKMRRQICAHNHAIQALAFNSTGSMIASASTKGTLVRVFDIVKGSLLQEFRRGTNNATILCINFSSDSTMLCVSSNHSTIHVFEFGAHNRSFSIWGSSSGIRIQVPKKHEIRQCTFERNSTIIIAIGLDGSYYSFYLDKNSGQYCQQNYFLFIELNNNEQSSFESCNSLL